MNAADVATLAEFASLASAYLKICRDDHGRFASCGLTDERRQRRRAAGKHKRQKRRRKPRSREHADWIRHFRGEDRELARDVKRERRQLRREQRKERREQRRDARRAIRDMHREYPKSGSRRGSATRQNVADQIRNDRAALREDHAAARAQQRGDHQSTVESHHRTQRESHAEVLREVRSERHEGKAWRGKAVSPMGEIPTAHELATRAAKRAGLLEGWRANRLTHREHLDVLHAVRLEGRRILRSWAETLAMELNPGYEAPAKAMGAARAKVRQFFGRVRKFLGELVFAGVLSLSSPQYDVQAAKPLQDAVAALVAEHDREFLEPFEAEILDALEARRPRPERPPGGEPVPGGEPEPGEPESPLDGRFVARAEQYGSLAWHGTQGVQRSVAGRSNVFNFESREHFGINPDDLCPTCRREINRGIVPIGTLAAIGASECRANCHCAFNFYVDRNGPEYNTIFNGRGPMDPRVFGVTAVSHNY